MTTTNRYTNGKIYKIVSQQTDDVYIGSTCSPLSKRMVEHRSKYKMFLDNRHHYVSSFDILKYQDAVIVLIENFPCNSKEELFARENYWMDQFRDVAINSRAAPLGITKEEYLKQYREDHKDDMVQYQQQYYQDHKNDVWCCDLCDQSMHPGGKARHEKTKKHLATEERAIDGIFGLC